MTKLESGAVAPNVALHDLGEIVGSALRRAGRILPHHQVELELAPICRCSNSMPCCSSRCCSICSTTPRNMPPPDTTIRIQSLARAAIRSRCRSLDEGERHSAGDLEHIFDKFYRAQKTDQVRAGTGLGLAISRGFVEAMHGTIVAANRTDRSGAVFTITLPIPRERQRLDAAA